MAFRVAARTVLELGAELISSDAIAIYELVKNAFDAGSTSVRVDVVVVLRRSGYEKLADGLRAEAFGTTEAFLRELRHQIGSDIDETDADAFVEAVVGDGSDDLPSRLLKAYVDRNHIRVRDSGSGMSLTKLRRAFLTIGTANRVTGPRVRDDGRRILGEKGVGRLSAMRLGSLLRVRTAREADPRWNILEIDWDDFAADPTLMIDEVAVDAFQGREKSEATAHGTVLTIRNLASDWSEDSLQAMAAGEFSRLVDPFLPTNEGFPIEVRFNGREIRTKRISSLLFKNAHGYCRGRYEIERRRNRAGATTQNARLTADFEYRLYSESRHFDLGPSELRDAIGENVPEGALVGLGPFTFEFYWYNRRVLTAIDGIGKMQDVRKLVNAWSGGLMLFRDGFRVNPYGAEGDDWLDLNSQAFKSSGYLLNTDQLIGRVLISGEGNPNLVDQTNREGLRDTFEKAALTSILRKFLTGYLKEWMDDVNLAYQGLKQVDLSEIEGNVERHERRVRTNLKELREKFPGQEPVLRQLVKSFSDMKLAFDKAKAKADAGEGERQRLLDLAGIGLMVEVVAHELARATKHTLNLLQSARRGDSLPTDVRVVFDNLQAQLQTIERRLRVLDPLSVSGRQRRTEFDLHDVLKSTFEARSEDLADAGVRWSIVRADGRAGPLWVKAVRGMMVQIVENLLANSLHWLGVEKSSDSQFRPEIKVEVSAEHGGGFVFTDNGPGIAPQAAEQVFNAFFSTRRDDGRGLGLFISRENARHFGGDLRLLQERRVHEDRLNSFQFVMSADTTGSEA